MSVPELVVVAPGLRDAQRLAVRAGLATDRWVWCADEGVAAAWCRSAADRGVPLAVWREEPPVAPDVVAAAVVLSQPAPARRRASPPREPRPAPTPAPPAPARAARPAPRLQPTPPAPEPARIPNTPTPGSRIPTLSERLEARRRAERRASTCS